jgi:hypothetical protein
MFIKRVVAFSSKVKVIIDTAKDAAIRIGRFLFLVSPTTEPPMITGNNGRTHGASTVSIPARKAPNNKNIIVINPFKSLFHTPSYARSMEFSDYYLVLVRASTRC